MSPPDIAAPVAGAGAAGEAGRTAGAPAAGARSAAAGRIAGGVLLAAASALLALAAFPPYDLWPLIFVAFVPMAIAQHRVLPERWAGLAPAVAFGLYFAGHLSPGLADGQVAWYLQLAPLYLAAVIAALYHPGRHFHRATGYRWLAISVPVTWVAIDAARALSGSDVLGATWGNPAYALYGQAWLLQPLALFGIFGLQLLLLAVNFGLAALAIAALDRRRPPAGAPAVDMPRALRWAGGIGAAAAAWVATSLLMLESPAPGLRVGAVLSNGPGDRGVEVAKQMAATRQLAAQGARVVVWREGGLGFDPLRERTGEFRTLAAETGAHVVVGYGTKDPDGTRRNEAVVFAPDGTAFGPYGKAHPGRFAGDHSDTGGDYKVYDTALGRIATIICYDLDFTDSARAMARRGARFVAVPSNDVPAIADKHYTHLVFRAIENRLPMAKADSLYAAAIVDPYGRILAREVNPIDRAEARRAYAADVLPAETVIADVPLGGGGTLAMRLGDWVGWLAIAAALGWRAVRVRAWLRSR